MSSYILWLLLFVIATCFMNCSDDKESDSMRFDPSKEVAITRFTPESGGAFQQLLIYGKNFGSDISMVTVTIGGQEATIVSATGQNIYCYVPVKAFSGTIEVTINDGKNVRQATAKKAFEYKPEMMVSTLCGYRTTEDRSDWITGPFETAYGFRSASELRFDPVNKSHLYICYDGYNYIQMIDLEKRQVTNAVSVSSIGLNNRVRSIAFSKASAKHNKAEGQYMIFTIDNDSRGTSTPNVFMIERNANGTFDNSKPIITLASYKQCNGAIVHPINGEVYFNSYEKGQVFRVDMDDYFANPTTWNPNAIENSKIQQLFTIADPSWEFKITFHPDGSYAYLNVINNHYILRADYNSETKRLITPYIIAGGYKASGYLDGVGTSARFNQPYQGVFVKNEDITVGDPYEYYITEFSNHSVRKITADGIVSTYAGRGTNGFSSDNNHWGADDGALRTQARFRDPSGMAYDEENRAFYLHSTVGRTIRTISIDKEETLPEGESTETNE